MKPENMIALYFLQERIHIISQENHIDHHIVIAN